MLERNETSERIAIEAFRFEGLGSSVGHSRSREQEQYTAQKCFNAQKCLHYIYYFYYIHYLTIGVLCWQVPCKVWAVSFLFFAQPLEKQEQEELSDGGGWWYQAVSVERALRLQYAWCFGQFMSSWWQHQDSSAVLHPVNLFTTSGKRKYWVKTSTPALGWVHCVRYMNALISHFTLWHRDVIEPTFLVPEKRISDLPPD